jgi:WD40 repeat protein
MASDPFVFVSYSRPDSEYVEGLVAYLAEHRISAWIDRERINNGDRWAALIENQVANCSAMVVVMSPAAAASEWVEREIALAQARQKTILPLLLAGEPLFRIINVHYDDVRDGRIPPPGFVQQLRTLTGVQPGAEPAARGSAPPVQPRKLSGPRRSADPLPVQLTPRPSIINQYGPALATAIAPDGSWFATGCADQYVRLWDSHTGDLLVTQARHAEPIRQVFIAPDGEYLITVTDNALRWWDSSTALAEPLRVWHRPVPGATSPASPAGPTARGAPRKHRAVTATSASPPSVPAPPVKGPSAAPGFTPPPAALSPDGMWLAMLHNESVLRIDATPGGAGGEVIADLRQQRHWYGDLGPVAISADGRRLAVADGSHHLRLIDVPERNAVAQPAFAAGVAGTLRVTNTAIAWAPSGTWLLTATLAQSTVGSGPVTVWGTLKGDVLGHLGNPRIGVHALVMSPREDWFGTGDETGVTLWRAATREPLTMLPTPAVRHLSLSPDAAWLVIATEAGIVGCDVRYSEPGQTTTVHSGQSSRDRSTTRRGT